MLTLDGYIAARRIARLLSGVARDALLPAIRFGSLVRKVEPSWWWTEDVSSSAPIYYL